MSEENTLTACSPDSGQNRTPFLDLLFVLARRWKMLALICLAAFVLSCIWVLVLPNMYTATASIMPPDQEQGSLTGALSNVSGLASLVGLNPSGTTADLYLGMLQSQTIADAIIDRFHLMQVYKQKSRLWTYDVLDKYVTFKEDPKSNIVTVSVEGRDPVRAAQMANAYVEQLQKLKLDITTRGARREKAFFQGRLAAVNTDLDKAQQRLKAFQQEHQTFRLDKQASALIDAIAKLRGELASKQIQLGVLRSYQTPQNPQVLTLEEAITQVKGQIRQLENSPAGKRSSENIFLGTAEMPGLALQYERLMSDFKTQETLYELLTRQYEIARINEARNASTIQFLDRATPPDRKSRPRRTLLVIGATVLAFILGIFLLLTLEYTARLPEEERRRWRQLRELLPLNGTRGTRS